MATHRDGERGHPPSRNSRFVFMNGAWYFSSRGKMIHGPFEDRDTAEEALGTFLRGVGARPRWRTF